MRDMGKWFIAITLSTTWLAEVSPVILGRNSHWMTSCSGSFKVELRSSYILQLLLVAHLLPLPSPLLQFIPVYRWDGETEEWLKWDHTERKRAQQPHFPMVGFWGRGGGSWLKSYIVTKGSLSNLESASIVILFWVESYGGGDSKLVFCQAPLDLAIPGKDQHKMSAQFTSCFSTRDWIRFESLPILLFCHSVAQCKPQEMVLTLSSVRLECNHQRKEDKDRDKATSFKTT